MTHPLNRRVLPPSMSTFFVGALDIYRSGVQRQVWQESHLRLGVPWM